MKDLMGSIMIIVGFIVMILAASQADYSIATRSVMSDLELLKGLGIGLGLMIGGMYLKGFVGK